MKKPLQIGQILDDKYRLDRLIAQGGMGQVYEATHLLIHRKVAIKTLRLDAVSDVVASKRLKQEAEIAGSLGHDNICDVLDMGLLGDRSPYIVMPLLSGHSLREILDIEKSVSVERAIDIVGQVLSGLEAVHGRQIIHRDLKPENIFITQVGDRADFVKILDFGISKHLKNTDEMSLTETGHVPGTLYYLSPEQVENAPIIDHRTDIYATGVLLYEMVCGQRPFEGETCSEVYIKIVSKSFMPPTAIRQDIPSGLERVICRALSKDPQCRFQSTAEMARALRSESTIRAVPSPLQNTTKALANGGLSSPRRIQPQKRATGRWVSARNILILIALCIAAALTMIFVSRYPIEVEEDVFGPLFREGMHSEAATPASSPIPRVSDKDQPHISAMDSTREPVPQIESSNLHPEKSKTTSPQMNQKTRKLRRHGNPSKKKPAPASRDTKTMTGINNTVFVRDYGE